jgi:hypothetical protein
MTKLTLGKGIGIRRASKVKLECFCVRRLGALLILIFDCKESTLGYF